MGASAMITTASGNLLRDDAEALVNTVNTVGVMGKGIALQFKRAYPAMFKDYARACRAGEVEIGHMHVWETGSLDGPRYIINFPTKRHWRSRSRLADVEAGLADLAGVIERLRIRSVAIPPLGCGHGGLAWGDVEPRIRAALAGLATDVDIRIYPPDGAPPSREMINRSAPPPLSSPRAAMLVMMDTYRRRTYEDPSLLVVQKVMYFLQTAGEPLGLKFARGRYGPYADNLRITLRDMDGHYLDGFGDGSSTVAQAEPLVVRPEAAVDAAQVLDSQPETQERVDRVLDVIDGFESPYGLELLASVHWVTTEDPTARREPGAATQLVRQWTSRKARLFTEEHVGAAWEQLRASGWISLDPSASREVAASGS